MGADDCFLSDDCTRDLATMDSLPILPRLHLQVYTGILHKTTINIEHFISSDVPAH